MANKSREIPNLEDFIQQMKSPDDESNAKKKRRVVPSNVDRSQSAQQQKKALDRNYVQKEIEVKPEKHEIAKTSSTFLERGSKTIINNFIGKYSKTKQLKQQIEAIEKAMITYEKTGNQEAYENCKRKLEQLKGNFDRFEEIIQGPSTEERNRMLSAAYNSKEVKEYRKKLIALEDKKAANSSSSICNLFDNIRKSIKDANEIAQYSGVNINMGNDIIQDIEKYTIDDHIDDLISTNPEERLKLSELKKLRKSNPPAAFYKLCEIIADLTDSTPEEIRDMKRSKLKELLDLFVDNKERREELDNEILYAKAELNALIKEVSGQNDIVDVLFTIFDMKEQTPEEEKEIKDILTATHRAYAIGIAFNICNKANKLQYFEDVICYALEGFCKALNKFLEYQRMKDNPISFLSVASKYITSHALKGLGEVSSNTVNGNNLSTIIHFDKKRYNDLKVIFGESIPESVIKEKLKQEQYDIFGIQSASQFEKSVAGGNGKGDDDDVNADNYEDQSEKDKESIFEVQQKTEEFFKCLKILFSMLDKDSKGRSKGKIFNEFEIAFIRMHIGLDKKFDETTKEWRNYKLSEMGDVLLEIKKKYGSTQGTYSQSSVSYWKEKVLGNIDLYEANQAEWERYNAAIAAGEPAEKPKKKIVLKKGKLQTLLDSNPEIKKTLIEFMQTMKDSPSNYSISRVENDSNIEDELSEIINNKSTETDNDTDVDLNMVLGDDVNSAENDEFFSKWNDVIDLTGLNSLR